MRPGNRQLDLTKELAVELDLEQRTAPFGAHVDRQQPRIARVHAVPDHFRRTWRCQPVRAWIVAAEHDRSRRRRELLECPMDISEVGVYVEMVRLDIRDYGDGRRERQKRPIILVGF